MYFTEQVSTTGELVYRKGLGPPDPQFAIAAALGPGAAGTAMGHLCRLGALGGGRGKDSPGLGPGWPEQGFEIVSLYIYAVSA